MNKLPSCRKHGQRCRKYGPSYKRCCSGYTCYKGYCEDECSKYNERCYYDSDCCSSSHECIYVGHNEKRCRYPCQEFGDPCGDNDDCCGKGICYRGYCKHCKLVDE